MKRYHELCHFVNEVWQPVGFTLYDTQTNCYKFVSLAEFSDLVRAESVQYFVWDAISNSIAIAYNEEERETLKDNSKSSLDYTISDYWADDLKAPYYFYDYLTSGNNFMMGLCTKSINNSVIGTVVQMYLIGSRETLGNFIRGLREKDKRLVKVSKDGIYMLYPVRCSGRPNEDVYFNDMLISTEIFKRKELLRRRKSDKKQAITGNSSHSVNLGDIVDIVTFFDEISEKTLSKYKKYIHVSGTETVQGMKLFGGDNT